MNINFKKILFILIVLFFFVMVFLFVISKSEMKYYWDKADNYKSNVYVNKELGFSVEFPYSWALKYGIYNWKDGITVYKLNPSNEYTEKTMVFFGIERIKDNFTKEEVENIENPSTYIMNNNGYTYIWRLPSKEQYPSPEDGNSYSDYEYVQMSQSLDEIRKSIKPTEIISPDYQQQQIDIISERIGISSSYLKDRGTVFNDIVVNKYKYTDSSLNINFDLEQMAESRGVDINDYIGKEVDIYLYDLNQRKNSSSYIFVFEDDKLIGYEKIQNNKSHIVKQVLNKICNTSSSKIEYALKNIITSTLYSNNSQSNRVAETNKMEFDLLVSLGRDTLYYFGKLFSRGGQVGVRGKVMEEICRTILSDKDIKYTSQNGQDWFDAYKNYIESNIQIKGIEEVKKQNYDGVILVKGYSY